MVLPEECLVFYFFWVTEMNEETWMGFSGAFVFFLFFLAAKIPAGMHDPSAVASQIRIWPSELSASSSRSMWGLTCKREPARSQLFKLCRSWLSWIQYGGAAENKGAICPQKGRKALRVSLLTQIFEALVWAPGGKQGLLPPFYCRGVNHIGRFAGRIMSVILRTDVFFWGFFRRRHGKYCSNLALAEVPSENKQLIWRQRDAYFSKPYCGRVPLSISFRLLLPCRKGHHPSRWPPCWIATQQLFFFSVLNSDVLKLCSGFLSFRVYTVNALFIV